MATPAQQVPVTITLSQVQSLPQDHVDMYNDFAMDIDFPILQPPSVAGSQPISTPPLEQPQTSPSQQRRHRQKVTTKPAASLDAETGFVATCDAMGPTSMVHEWHRDLGFYDDLSDFDDLHNDPLAHTSPIASEDEDELSTTTPPLTPVHAHEVREMSHSQEFPTSYPPPRPLHDIYQGCHEIWWARVIIALIAFLHTKHRLSFRGCSLLLFCLNTIFMTLALLPSTQNLPLTLNTVIHRLNLVCAAPIHLPLSLLVDFLSHAEIEKACDSWKQQARVPGKINDISEGHVWSSLKDKEGNPFFSRDSASEELHLGITLSLDWFTRKTSVYGPNHSFGVMSMGYHVHMALLAAVCDHPAMCKMGGFADHSHNKAPCNKCHVDQASIFSDESLQNCTAFLSTPNGYYNLFNPEFPPRTSEDHCRNCFKEHSLETDEERDEFFKKHGARWTELA
ncbi:hypothetical protein EV702DRAFT_1192945 [Suillus placidus]|uniref:Uncharacterized protein n=1 Tax=Suillus placidus TaxID=48579 RepID=A0A9P7A464_9AGAM|nr:hypothetical protein EV702DRAFT_1192945 [Suillus placidus]